MLFRKIHQTSTGAQCTPLRVVQVRSGGQFAPTRLCGTIGLCGFCGRFVNRPYGICVSSSGLCKNPTVLGAPSRRPLRFARYFTYRRDSPRGCPFWRIAHNAVLYYFNFSCTSLGRSLYSTSAHLCTPNARTSKERYASSRSSLDVLNVNCRFFPFDE